jgi:hypothetical protein
VKSFFCCRIVLFSLFFSVFSFSFSVAQVKDSVNIGSAKGIIQDSAFNFVLTSATVAVYRDKDSSLLQYSLPNTFGEFSFGSLPVGTALRMVITHVGYKALTKTFSVSKAKPEYEFGKINLLRKEEGDNELAEIVVTPIRMNGDTLEFNASAFKLDKNATTEDLLRKLPGFTIWSDGEITFNGKKINSVLVEGKPFMGGDFASATQNLPKDAIQKVQVYQQVNQNNLYDSTTNVNLKLKEDKKMGRFGKISAGYGTDKHYSGDGMMSGFNKKMQVSVVGAANNINKQANSAQQLIENSSYKGEGASIDYQPNFRMGGLNKPMAAGITFQYDFVPDPNWQNTHRFNSDYFLSGNNALNISNTITNRFLGKDSLLVNNSASRNSNTNISQRLNARYEKNTRKLRFTVSGNVGLNDNQSFNESNAQQERTGAGMISTTESKTEHKQQSKNYNLNLSLQRQEVDYSRTRPRQFTLNYVVGIIDNDGSSMNNTKFRSLADPTLNKDYSRLYEQQDQFSLNNQLSFEYPALRQLVFGKKRIGNINIGISNNIALHNNQYTDKVQDYDTTAKQYGLNNYLTNKRDLDIVNMQPSLNFSKHFSKSLSNRYHKSLSISAKVKGQYYYMQHKATQLVQNFVQEYKRFTPEASINYNNYQYGRYSSGYTLSYNQTAGYPQVNHIAPLIDSSNVFYLPKGNREIRPQTQQVLSFNFNLNGQKPNDQYYVYTSLSIGKTDGMIADSSFYDSSGRRIVYSVNVNGYRYVNGTVNFRKPFKLNKFNTIQTTMNARFNANQTPGYINNVLNIAGTRSAATNLDVNYSFKDILSIKLQQEISFSRSKQRGFSNDVFNSKTISTGISGALQLPKNLTWSSHVMYVSNTANKRQPINFTLWNANLTYRFLKGNRGEVKFSALDLLRQNKSIINTAGPNYQSFGYTNVLQQYFMLTLSYYPRKFGR